MRFTGLAGIFLLGLTTLLLSGLFLPPVKWGVGGLGALLMALSYFSPSEKTLKKIAYYDQQSAACRPFVAEWTAVLAVTFALLLGNVTMAIDSDLRNSWLYHLLTSSWGFWETIQFIALFLASSTLFIGVWKFHKTFAYRYSTVFPIFFGCLFLVAAGEEVGWGLPLMEGWEGDTTLLPLRWIGLEPNGVADQALKAIIIIYAIVFPLFAFSFRSVKLMAEQLSIPLPHASFVPFCIGAIVLSYPVVLTKLFGVVPEFDMSEFRETVFYMTVLGASVLAVKKWRWRALQGARR